MIVYDKNLKMEKLIYSNRENRDALNKELSLGEKLAQQKHKFPP